MKKKLIIGLIIVVVIVAIAIYFYKRNKKASQESLPLSQGISPEKVGGTQSSLGPSSTPTVASNNPNPASKVYNFVTVVADEKTGKAKIMYQPLTDKFQTGDSVKILAGPYAGTHKIWYVYNFTQGGLIAGAGQVLYLETPFTVTDKGTFQLA